MNETFTLFLSNPVLFAQNEPAGNSDPFEEVISNIELLEKAGLLSLPEYSPSEERLQCISQYSQVYSSISIEGNLFEGIILN